MQLVEYLCGFDLAEKAISPRRRGSKKYTEADWNAGLLLWRPTELAETILRACLWIETEWTTEARLPPLLANFTDIASLDDLLPTHAHMRQFYDSTNALWTPVNNYLEIKFYAHTFYSLHVV